MKWLRLYTDITDDRKLRRLTPAQRWLWIALLTEARKSPEPGCLMLTDGVPTTPDDLADIAAIDVDDVHAGLEAFEQQRMIAWDDGVIMLVNWDKRQFESDNSTERWRRWKERQDNQQPSNDETTIKEEAVKQHTNVGANVGPTPPDTENREQRTETEKEGEERAPTGDAPAPADEQPELTKAEEYVAGCVQAVRGMANVPSPVVIAHIRECLDNRGSPVPELVMRREFQKFRDHWQDKRKNQPVNGKWPRWKSAVTNWMANIDDEPGTNGRSQLDALYPEFTDDMRLDLNYDNQPARKS